MAGSLTGTAPSSIQLNGARPLWHGGVIALMYRGTMDTSWTRQISYCRPECFEVTWLGLAAWQLS